MGRIGVDLYPVQIGVPLADVGRSPSGSAGAPPTSPWPRPARAQRRDHEGRRRTVRAVSAARWAVRRRSPVGRHPPNPAHAARVLRDPPARRLPAAVLPRADRAGSDDRGQDSTSTRSAPRGCSGRPAPGSPPSRAAPRRSPRSRAGPAASLSTTSTTGPCSGPTVRGRPLGARGGRARDRGGRQPRRGRGRRGHAGPARRRPAARARRRRSRSSSAGPRACSRHPDELREVAPGAGRGLNGLGAGDAFGGSLVHGLLHGWELERTLRVANAAGAYVAGRLACADAMPSLKDIEEVLAPSRRRPATTSTT